MLIFACQSGGRDHSPSPRSPPGLPGPAGDVSSLLACAIYLHDCLFLLVWRLLLLTSTSPSMQSTKNFRAIRPHECLFSLFALSAWSFGLVSNLSQGLFLLPCNFDVYRVFSIYLQFYINPFLTLNTRRF